MEEEIYYLLTAVQNGEQSIGETANQLLDLFAISSRTLVPNEIKDELQRRIGIIESETDDFTRQSMISNLTIDLI